MFTLPLKICYIDLPIRHLRSRKEVRVDWPIIPLSSWVTYELGQGGNFLLAGNSLEEPHMWKPVLRSFWCRYQKMDGGHPLFSSGYDWDSVIPYMVHGDEGRGRGKQPLLTISFQGILSHYGPHRLNSSGTLSPNW